MQRVRHVPTLRSLARTRRLLVARPPKAWTKFHPTKRNGMKRYKKYGLQQRTLEQLCVEGSFSASTVPKEAFLTIRCIRPEKKRPKDATYIANLECFFNEDHSDGATKLINRNILGLDKLKTLYRIICNPKEPRKRTPPKYFGTLADGLGPFLMLVNVYNQLLDRSIQAPTDERPLGGAPERIRFYDATRPSAVHGGYRDDVGYRPIARCPTCTRPPAATSVTEPTDEEPPRRTPTETLVADFMVTLLGGLASLVQALNPRPLCIANSFETTYTFGPIRNTSQQQVDVQFRARIAESIPFGLSLAGMPREAAIFEAKRAARPESRGSIPVLAQHSMEHVAYIWKRHEDDPTVIPTPYLCMSLKFWSLNLLLTMVLLQWKTKVKTYHTFIVAQDHLYFHISIGTYDNTYLEYIFGPGIRAFDEEELGKFLHIMLSSILWQLEQTETGTTFKKALS
ncbi:hypothetical protein AJ80_04035 [Polytolypa hystricis UAMH7299]|uniref:Uncharacterized protein n=1 Tax=Polytolypa hystricis (strain UAMH7299) TaxID=1447883 RepID=A0A2B7YEH6_POLH7|nr:hypothetical protein AJ80_04035 [Polytolypa hystricis UAMH7299]